MNKQLSINKDERGVVAIILTVFVLIVLSLVVIAFSQTTRRNQRQALDQQLSTQAQYAAESGVNELVSKVMSGDPDLQAKHATDCEDGITKGKVTRQLDQNDKAFTISCALFDTHPLTLRWGSIDTTQGEVVSLHAEGDLHTLKVKWKRAQNTTSEFGGCPLGGSVISLPADASSYYTSCDAGMLRMQFIPYQAGANRDTLYDRTFTVFGSPARSVPVESARVGYEPHAVVDGLGLGGPESQGKIVASSCSNETGNCEMSITALPTGTVYLQIRSIYHANAVDIEGFNSSGVPVRFDQAQMMVDVTGKASDVVKRIQVRKSMYERYTAPSAVTQSMKGVCKQLGVRPASGGDPGYATNQECN